LVFCFRYQFIVFIVLEVNTHCSRTAAGLVTYLNHLPAEVVVHKIVTDEIPPSAVDINDKRDLVPFCVELMRETDIESAAAFAPSVNSDFFQQAPIIVGTIMTSFWFAVAAIVPSEGKNAAAVVIKDLPVATANRTFAVSVMYQSNFGIVVQTHRFGTSVVVSNRGLFFKTVLVFRPSGRKACGVCWRSRRFCQSGLERARKLCLVSRGARRFFLVFVGAAANRCEPKIHQDG
jgi:hypothetical protein